MLILAEISRNQSNKSEYTWNSNLFIVICIIDNWSSLGETINEKTQENLRKSKYSYKFVALNAASLEEMV